MPAGQPGPAGAASPFGQDETINSGEGEQWWKKVTFACCFLFSKLNLTLVAFFSLISEYRASVDMTVAVAVSDPCVHLARKKSESEKYIRGGGDCSLFADDYSWPL